MSITKRWLDDLNAELEVNEEEFYQGYAAHMEKRKNYYKGEC